VLSASEGMQVFTVKILLKTVKIGVFWYFFSLNMDSGPPKNGILHRKGRQTMPHFPGPE
jgi:hypothetical protein